MGEMDSNSAKKGEILTESEKISEMTSKNENE